MSANTRATTPTSRTHTPMRTERERRRYGGLCSESDGGVYRLTGRGYRREAG